MILRVGGSGGGGLQGVNGGVQGAGDEDDPGKRGGGEGIARRLP